MNIAAACVALAAAVLSADPASAVEYNLQAGTVVLTMPDCREVTMWGYGLEGGDITVPGPQLVVPPGDSTLTINLTNNLPEPTCIVVPSLIAEMTPVRNGGAYLGRVRSFTHEAAAGGGVATYTWPNVRPGTYLYHSGTHPGVQVQMGLHGAVTHNSAAGVAYPAGDNPQTSFDSEVVIVYSEIDPVIHEAVAVGQFGPGLAMTSPIGYSPRYYLVNGAPYDSETSTPIAAGTAGDDVLLRFVNASYREHTPGVFNHYMDVRAEDAYPYVNSMRNFSLLVPAMQTKDAIISPTEAGTYALYDRSLNLTNGSALGGGMLIQLDVAAAP
jgi:FtsP/CotA-like multicopper oxidase with cupredoxin domain